MFVPTPLSTTNDTETAAENQADAGQEAVALPAVISVPEVPEAGRDLALVIIATVAAVFALQWAQGFFISLLLGILFAYTLSPLVAWLEQIHIPRALGTSSVSYTHLTLPTSDLV